MSVNIFLSHKSEDFQTAREVKDLLQKNNRENDFLNFFLPENMKIFLSEEMTQGQEWYPWIKQHLVESNLLLLLFTDVTQDWDWCLYEAGLFDRLDDTHHRHVICLHPSQIEPPKPLRHLQTVPATPHATKLFLEKLYTEIQLTGLAEPIAPRLVALRTESPKEFENLLERAAQQLMDLIDHRPTKKRSFCDYFILRIKEPQAIHPDQIPPDASVESRGRTLSNLFGLGEREWPWQDVEMQARKKRDTRWINELAKAIHQASQDRAIEPLRAPLYAVREQKIYRPLLAESTWEANGEITFKIVFYEGVSWLIEDIPKRQGNLLTSLVMATRFRYELLEKYGGHLPQEITEEEKEQLYSEIAQVIEHIEEEAEFHHMFEQEELVAAFSDTDQPTIHQMYNKWYRIREQLKTDLDTKNSGAIESHLLQLREINTQYLDLATRRYAELMAIKS